MLNDAADAKLKALYLIGEDALAAYPNRATVEKALENSFLVVQDVFLSSTAEKADVVFPAVTFAEKDGTFTNTDRRIQRCRTAVPPVGDSRPDCVLPEIKYIEEEEL